MVFRPILQLQSEPPDSISIEQFMFDPAYGRAPYSEASTGFICGLSGKTYPLAENRQRVNYLARALSKEFGFKPNEGSEYDKVVGVFTVNAIDQLSLCWAVHRIGGIASPANAAYNAAELAYQLKAAGAKCLFTSLPNLAVAREAAKEVGIPANQIFLFSVPDRIVTQEMRDMGEGFRTVDSLIEEGKNAEQIDELKWEKGEGMKRTAFLCFSSGTSGLPKGVMISHYNVIANVLQYLMHDASFQSHMQSSTSGSFREVTLGLLPFSHIYALVLVCHAQFYRGTPIVVLPKFELATLLAATQEHRITTLVIVPPIIILLTKNQAVLDSYDLSSVKCVFTGAAPLGKETANDLLHIFPHWLVRQGYGMTETATLLSWTEYDDIDFGSSGTLIAGVEAKIVDPEGREITAYDTPGELIAKSPSSTLGYLNNEKATKETFLDGGWVRTGDEVVIRKSPGGKEHLWIVDRIKELIKVKGHQVAPAELEAHLLTHPAVADCAVIPVPDERAGEVPKAFVVKSSAVGLEDSDRIVKRAIARHVERHKSSYKWLKGGVEFVDLIPKSASGKILRRMLRDREREARRKEAAKL